MRTRSWLAIIFSLLFPALLLPAQANTPEQVMSQMLEALRKQDWKAFTALTHPDALQDFKRMFHDVIAVDTSHKVSTYFFQVSSLEAYDAISPASIYEQFMSKIYSIDPTLEGTIANATFDIIGSVKEGNDTAYVVYKIKMKSDAKEIQQLDVQAMKTDQGQWKSMLRKDVDAIAEQLKKSLQDPNDQ